jgi:hypothetical protein
MIPQSSSPWLFSSHSRRQEKTNESLMYATRSSLSEPEPLTAGLSLSLLLLRFLLHPRAFKARKDGGKKGGKRDLQGERSWWGCLGRLSTVFNRCWALAWNWEGLKFLDEGGGGGGDDEENGRWGKS